MINCDEICFTKIKFHHPTSQHTTIYTLEVEDGGDDYQNDLEKVSSILRREGIQQGICTLEVIEQSSTNRTETIAPILAQNINSDDVIITITPYTQGPTLKVLHSYLYNYTLTAPVLMK